ncbi:hypothetical protein ADEAN_000618900 [Angomonas deanei]|uniref:Uncharacterized protein n=1 Tax=Angomonas deanei TaxID=59799 RepID=A0A7G2CFM5_9TRYP|nr:hypothetical protein ADEAN_000618900 [Angomonas deanei]
MRKLQWPLATVFGKRFLSGFSDSSVLGTSTMSSNFVKSLRDDLRNEENSRKRGMGETLTNYINSAELTHMESPDEDVKFVKKLEHNIDDFFSKIPLPDDPMKMALRKSEEEMEEEAELEMIKEAYREAYLRKLDRKQAEEVRLKMSAKRLERAKDASDFFNSGEYGSVSAGGKDREVPKKGAAAETEDGSEESIRRQLKEMRLKMEELEKLLEKK